VRWKRTYRLGNRFGNRLGKEPGNELENELENGLASPAKCAGYMVTGGLIWAGFDVGFGGFPPNSDEGGIPAFGFWVPLSRERVDNQLSCG
jgi:hypothetical protein